MKKLMLSKLVCFAFIIPIGQFFYFLFCATLTFLFFAFEINIMDAALNHKTSVSITLLQIAASITAIDSFFIKKTSLIKFAPQLTKKLKTELSRLSLIIILTLIAMSAIIYLSPYLKTDFTLIALVLSAMPLSLFMFNVPSALTSLATDRILIFNHKA